MALTLGQERKQCCLELCFVSTEMEPRGFPKLGNCSPSELPPGYIFVWFALEAGLELAVESTMPLNVCSPCLDLLSAVWL